MNIDAIARIGIALVLPLAVVIAQSADYPAKPIRIIVHSPPGGAPDVVARIIAERLGPALGQPVIVDNRPGASGTIALAAVAKAEPDGHTLGTMSPPQIVAPALMSRLPYDTARDLAPVRETTRASMLLVVRADSPLRTVAALLAAGKAQPGRLTYGSAGNGTPQHLAAEAFKRAAGIDLHHVPYKGAPAAVSAMLGEQIDLMFTSAVTIGAHIRAGKLRPLATTGASRQPDFAEVPTLAELGFAGFEVRDWQGLIAPANTPQPILERIAREVAKVLAQPEVSERLAAVGVERVGESDPARFGALLRREAQRWSKLVHEAGLRAD